MRQFLTRKLVLVAPRRRLLPAALPVAETGNLALAAGDVADGHVRRLHARDAGKDQEKPAPPKWADFGEPSDKARPSQASPLGFHHLENHTLAGIGQRWALTSRVAAFSSAKTRRTSS